MKSIDLPEIVEKGLSLGVKSIFFFPGFPVLGSKGGIVKIGETTLLNSDVHSILKSTTTPWQYERFEEDKELDYTFGIERYGRFRVNAFLRRQSIGLVARPIPTKVPSFAMLNLPDKLKSLTKHHDGLVLVTGPAGSGKSTTMAALVDFINQERNCHIVTIEDPVEHIYRPGKCIITQREIGKDTRSYDEALRRVLRQDPDVIFIGEIRDGNLMRMVLEIAETGHLVLSTLHTENAVQTLNRILDFFPSGEQKQVRTQLAEVLRAIASQRLLPRADGRGFACAGGLMLTNHAIKNLIREGNIHQIPSIMEISRKEGMITLDQSLVRLNRKGLIALPEAIRLSSKNKSFMEKLTEKTSPERTVVSGQMFVSLEKEETVYRSDFEAGRLRYFDGSGSLLDTPMGLLFRATGMKRKDFHFIADYSILNGAQKPFALRSIFHVAYKVLESSSGGSLFPFKVRIVSDHKGEIEIPMTPVDLLSDGNWQTLTIPIPKMYKERNVKYFMLLFDSDIREIVFNKISFL